jgi:hypothetical protein
MKINAGGNKYFYSKEYVDFNQCCMMISVKYPIQYPSDWPFFLFHSLVNKAMEEFGISNIYQ